MDELSAGNQSLLHWNLAPRAQAVGKFGERRFRAGIHGPALSMRVKNLVNRPLNDRAGNFFSSLGDAQ